MTIRGPGRADGSAGTRAIDLTYRFPSALPLLRLGDILSQCLDLGLGRRDGRTQRAVLRGLCFGHDRVHGRVIAGIGGLKRRDHGREQQREAEQTEPQAPDVWNRPLAETTTAGLQARDSQETRGWAVGGNVREMRASRRAAVT